MKMRLEDGLAGSRAVAASISAARTSAEQRASGAGSASAEVGLLDGRDTGMDVEGPPHLLRPLLPYGSHTLVVEIPIRMGRAAAAAAPAAGASQQQQSNTKQLLGVVHVPLVLNSGVGPTSILQFTACVSQPPQKNWRIIPHFILLSCVQHCTPTTVLCSRRTCC